MTFRPDRVRPPLPDFAIVETGIPPGIYVRGGQSPYSKYRRCDHCGAYILKDLFPEAVRDALFAKCPYCGRLTRNHARNRPKNGGNSA